MVFTGEMLNKLFFHQDFHLKYFEYKHYQRHKS